MFNKPWWRFQKIRSGFFNVVLRSLPVTLSLTVGFLGMDSHAAEKGSTSSKPPKGNTTIESFAQAKSHMVELYKKLPAKTFYCQCSFVAMEVETPSCPYSPKFKTTKKGKVNERAKRVEWEHVVPAHAFGYSFEGWRNHKTIKGCEGRGSRACARKMHPEFNWMESDLYNLVPAIGEINAHRSNKSMAMIEGEVREYGGCDVEIDSTKIEPAPQIRGDIARIYLYMDDAYPGRGIVSRKNAPLFAAWSKEDPIDEQEIARTIAIQALQGNCNHYVVDCTANSGTSPAGSAHHH